MTKTTAYKKIKLEQLRKEINRMVPSHGLEPRTY